MNHFEYGFFDELQKTAGMGSGALKGLALGGLGGTGLAALLAAHGAEDIPDLGGLTGPLKEAARELLFKEKLKSVLPTSMLLSGTLGGLLGEAKKKSAPLK